VCYSLGWRVVTRKIAGSTGVNSHPNTLIGQWTADFCIFYISHTSIPFVKCFVVCLDSSALTPTRIQNEPQPTISRGYSDKITKTPHGKGNPHRTVAMNTEDISFGFPLIIKLNRITTDLRNVNALYARQPCEGTEAIFFGAPPPSHYLFAGKWIATTHNRECHL
jgi:hypothetical protein